MSTWLVTDVHEWSMIDAQYTHAAISSQSTALVPTVQAEDHNHDHHEGVCSYDHGGHIGQVLATVVNATAFIPEQDSENPAYPDFWYTRILSPKLRPPIT